MLSFIINTVVYIGIVGLVIFALPAFLSKKLGTEYPIAAITSGSMWPVLHKGDLILIEAVGKDDLKKGDIIVWQNNKGFTIHRIAKLNEKNLVTKGDANFTEDEPIAYSDVIGRIVEIGDSNARVPYLGYVSILGAAFLADKR